MKLFNCLVLSIVLTSCQVKEKLILHDDGSGTIETVQNLDEATYNQLTTENYSKEKKIKDTVFYFKDIINKHYSFFFKAPDSDKKEYLDFKDVIVIVKKNLTTGFISTKTTQKFNSVQTIPNLFNTADYKENLEKKYPLSVGGQYYTLKYTFDGDVFRRIIKITSLANQEKKVFEIEDAKAQYFKKSITDKYVIDYNFPRKIKYVSNNNAKIGPDGKSFTIEYILSDCMQRPDITNLEVILENK